MSELKSINPYSGELNKVYTAHTDKETEDKLNLSHGAFLKWRKTSLDERRKILLSCASVLEENLNKYAALITREMGKVIKESKAEIQKSAWICRYYAENGGTFLADESLDVSEGRGKLVYDPLGTILAVMPWNFPFYQVFRFAPPTLMAGNVAVLKHASNVPGCSLAIEDIFRKAGLPDGVFQSLLISSSEVGKVIEHDAVKAVTLTGSAGAGSKVAAKAGKEIKKTVLELGGSDPFIVFEDADVEEAAKTAARARLINCGQSCIAAKRFVIQSSVYEKFSSVFKNTIEQMKFGDPMHEDTDFASLSSEQMANELSEQVKASKENGARLQWAHEEVVSRNTFFKPSILENIQPDSPAWSEELFGPVASFFSFDDDEQAVEIANSSPYGLGASIWSANINKAQQVARDIESGLIYINNLVASRPDLPFGGVKHSGYGRELSFLGIREFTNQKAIWFPR